MTFQKEPQKELEPQKEQALQDQELKGVKSEHLLMVARAKEALQLALDQNDLALVRTKVAELHPSVLADVIENLPTDESARLIHALGDDFNFEALAELDEGVRDKLLDTLPNALVARAVKDLNSDDAVYLLEDLKEADQSDILDQLPLPLRDNLERSLDFPEDSAGRLMQTEFIAVPPFWDVGTTIDFMRENDELPDRFSQIYVVRPDYHLVGMVPLDRLLRSKRPVKVTDLTTEDLIQIEADRDQESVARKFQRYNLFAAPVVDEDSRMLGVITVDDIVDVVEEEAEEDLHRLGGVGDEALSDTVLGIAKGRFFWLLINLFTAVVASICISQFDATLQQMVALAVLMPIVASMGGNAATQTMTVAVRALATRELSSLNAARIIFRETFVGLLNGLVFALIIALVTYIWFQNMKLALVIGGAMIVNMIVAGLSGILIPIILDKLKIDPAIASGVFVTTVTDVIGFTAFLGFAALWLL